jgi:hypothetical protein
MLRMQHPPAGLRNWQFAGSTALTCCCSAFAAAPLPLSLQKAAGRHYTYSYNGLDWSGSFPQCRGEKQSPVMLPASGAAGEMCLQHNLPPFTYICRTSASCIYTYNVPSSWCNCLELSPGPCCSPAFAARALQAPPAKASFSYGPPLQLENAAVINNGHTRQVAFPANFKSEVLIPVKGRWCPRVLGFATRCLRGIASVNVFSHLPAGVLCMLCCRSSAASWSIDLVPADLHGAGLLAASLKQMHAALKHIDDAPQTASG